MKISIIIPSQNDTSYIQDLLVYLKANIGADALEEIIIVNNFEDKHLIKMAEKAHAKLYIFKNSNHKLKADVGAFEAKGEILYFIKPGYFPPKDFGSKIIKAVASRKELGSLYPPLIAKICRFFNLRFMDSIVLFLSPMTNFFIIRSLFQRKGGLRHDGKTASFYQFIQNPYFKESLRIIQ